MTTQVTVSCYLRFTKTQGKQRDRDISRRSQERFETEPGEKVVDRLSFLGCRLPECPSAGGAATVGRWWKAVLWEISRELLPQRANRVNPRGQAEDVQVQEEAGRASGTTTLCVNPLPRPSY